MRRTYSVRVYTSHSVNAGTNEDIFVRFQANNGTYSNWVRLDNPGVDDFERGYADWFTFEDDDWIQGTGLTSSQVRKVGNTDDWNCHKVELYEGPAGTPGSRLGEFVYDSIFRGNCNGGPCGNPASYLVSIPPYRREQWLVEQGRATTTPTGAKGREADDEGTSHNTNLHQD